ncbi:MAG: OmpA family protein, partial [Leptonema sp. (in: Bacteria)]|nr:OmpA family protein [Leptonema sp. (in: bacteria)]
TEISEAESRKLQSIVNIMKANPTLKIEIQGHTDLTYRGPQDKSHAYNQKLSLDRAEAVKKRLVDLGVESNRLTVHGYSYDHPIVAAKDSVRGALNRRVEFKKID